MNVYIADEAGFCFGVKRALNIINQLNEKKETIHIYGPLIHNTTVLENLESRGIHCINSLDERDPGKKLIIRTHGIPREIEDQLKTADADYVDATCPLVKKLHHIIEKLNLRKTKIIIVGDKKHPEVIAAKSYAGNACVIDSVEEALAIEFTDSIDVIAQTTLDSDHFDAITTVLKEKTDKLEIHDTICNATKVRQKAVRKLASQVDLMLVIGGKNSSNTKKLYNISKKENKNTFHIETSSEIDSPAFIEELKTLSSLGPEGLESVGITAGASTPPEEIEIAKNKLKNKKNNYNSVKEMNHGKTKRYFDH
ncbi:MAG: 4-hydroxy-3-methylbut-2-enyl diphosphate reductase [bacterium]|nr:4-hydroxy-3-methylbut-2-enyl diphosphate reductase [bacterium]